MKHKNHNHKTIILIHTVLSVLIAALLFYFLEETFAKAFFYGSLVFNIYLRLLGFNFEAFVKPGDDETTIGKYKILLSIFSSLRTALVAGVLAIFILKFKFNLYALTAAFFLFQVILITSGLYFNRVLPKP